MSYIVYKDSVSRAGAAAGGTGVSRERWIRCFALSPVCLLKQGIT